MTDKVSDEWNRVTDGFNYIKSAVSGTFDRLSCTLNTTKWSIAGKLLIGTIGIAVGAEMLMGAAVGLIVGGTVYAATHKPDEFKIEDCLSDMGDGFLDGYAIGGAMSGAKGVFSLAKSWVKTGETTAKCTEVVSEGGKETTASGFDEWLNKGASDNKVYFGVDKKGRARYTGITKQSKDARLYQHNRSGKNFYDLEIQYDGLTRNQARAIEQYYIENGPNELNKINSIGINNKYYQDASNWAKQYLGIKE